MKQNTKEWLAWRKTKIGASDLPIILGISKWCTPFVLWQQKLGFLPDEEENYAMRHGKQMEPIALDLVNQEVGKKYSPQVVVHEKLEWAAASLDGITEDGSLLEIKCPLGKADHLSVEKGEVPEHYVPQLQWQMFVADGNECLYASYYQGQLVLLPLARDDDYILNTLLPAATKFYENMVGMIPPEKTEKDMAVTQIDDVAFEIAAQEWRHTKGQFDVLKAELKARQDRLIEFTDDGTCEGFGVRLSRIIRKGSIAWDKLWEKMKTDYPEITSQVNVSDYEKQEIGYWKVTDQKTK